MFMAIAGIQRKSYTATKDADLSLVIVFTAPCLRSWLHIALRLLWTHVLELTLCSVFWAWLPGPTSWALNVWLSALESDSWLTKVLRPLFRSRRFSPAQLFVWSLRQNRHSLALVKNAEDKIPSLVTHPRTHTGTQTYMLYIYIYSTIKWRLKLG